MVEKRDMIPEATQFLDLYGHVLEVGDDIVYIRSSRVGISTYRKFLCSGLIRELHEGGLNRKKKYERPFIVTSESEKIYDFTTVMKLPSEEKFAFRVQVAGPKSPTLCSRCGRKLGITKEPYCSRCGSRFL